MLNLNIAKQGERRKKLSILQYGKTKEKTVEEVILKNYDRYYRLAYSYVHNDADACDIVQNGAYKSILKAETLQKKEYAATWVYRIMLNEIFTFCKKDELLTFGEIPIEEGKEDTYENVDLKAALDKLSPEEKALVELRYYEDLKLEEIAEILNENVSTVKSRLYRCMKKLRIELEA